MDATTGQRWTMGSSWADRGERDHPNREWEGSPDSDAPPHARAALAARRGPLQRGPCGRPPCSADVMRQPPATYTRRPLCKCA
eukprot:ctg_342.g236